LDFFLILIEDGKGRVLGDIKSLSGPSNDMNQISNALGPTIGSNTSLYLPQLSAISTILKNERDLKRLT